VVISLLYSRDTSCRIPCPTRRSSDLNWEIAHGLAIGRTSSYYPYLHEGFKVVNQQFTGRCSVFSYYKINPGKIKVSDFAEISCFIPVREQCIKFLLHHYLVICRGRNQVVGKFILHIYISTTVIS